MHLLGRWSIAKTLRFIRAAAILMGAAVLAVIAIVYLTGHRLMSLPPPTGGSILEANLPAFSPNHILGTDGNGNDMASRLIHGGQTSLLIALFVNAIGLCVGGSLGAVSGWYGGLLDSTLMRVFDAFVAIPSLVLVLAASQIMGQSMLSEVLALACFSVPAFARLSRAAVLRIRELPFIASATLSGSSNSRILTRHILPAIFPQLATFAVLGMGLVINVEGAVSFLGLGMPPPEPTLGNMIYQGQMSLSATPMLVVLPGMVLLLSVLCFNVTAESLRRRWNLQ